jgi:alcohol dehydrogenase class IV
MRFTHETLPQRVRFASGAAAEGLAAEVDALGAHRVMVVSGRSQAELARSLAADLPVVAWTDDVAMHVPVEVAERGRSLAADAAADLLVCVGGGSTTGLAKAVALTTGLPIVAVPTTYAGSEVTEVWGLTERGTKTTGRAASVLPRAVVYDATLTVGLPVDLSVASGLNAVAHCVDSLWAPAADPVDAALAGEGLRLLAEGLPRVVAERTALEGREQVLLGAYLAAVAFASAGSGLHHKVCHVLGGMFGLPHAQTHAVVLPHVLALNAPHAPEASARVARALGGGDAVTALYSLHERLGAPVALRDLGMPADGVDAAVEAVVASAPPGNPAPVTSETVRGLVQRAWDGAVPSPGA